MEMPDFCMISFSMSEISESREKLLLLLRPSDSMKVVRAVSRFSDLSEEIELCEDVSMSGWNCTMS